VTCASRRPCARRVAQLTGLFAAHHSPAPARMPRFEISNLEEEEESGAGLASNA